MHRVLTVRSADGGLPIDVPLETAARLNDEAYAMSRDELIETIVTMGNGHISMAQAATVAKLVVNRKNGGDCDYEAAAMHLFSVSVDELGVAIAVRDDGERVARCGLTNNHWTIEGRSGTRFERLEDAIEAINDSDPRLYPFGKARQNVGEN